MIRAILFALAMSCMTGPADAEAPLTALARVEPGVSGVFDARGGPEVVLGLTRAVPWRMFTLDGPPRLVLDLAAATWPEGLALESTAARALETGTAAGGWSRLVVTLSRPMTVVTAGMETGRGDGGARLSVRLAPATAEDFAVAAGAPPGALPEPQSAGGKGSARR